jgi:hypothetical protein
MGVKLHSSLTLVEVIVQLLTRAAQLPLKVSYISIVYAGWAPKPVWTLVAKRKTLPGVEPRNFTDIRSEVVCKNLFLEFAPTVLI